MTLDSHASYPHTHAYVVKLRRDSDPTHGRIVGRLEHIDTGRSRAFSSMEELIAALLADLTSIQSEIPESGS